MSTISAGVTVPTALNLSGDTTGALTFQVSGTVTAATISSAGNFGIGTTSPIQRLTVESTSDVRATIRNSTENTSYASSLDFATGSGSLASTNVVARVQGLITQADPSALQSALAFHTNSGDSVSEKMRITSGGNVGINTTAPGNSRLRVQNSSGVFGNTDPIQSWAYANFQVTNLHLDGSVNPVFNTDADSNWNPPATMIWQFRGTERMRLTAGGDFYVGTSSDLGAAAQMQVVGSDADRIAMRCTGASAGNYWRFSVDTGNTIYVQNQSSTGVYMTNGGTSWIALSDERFKTDLKPIEDSVNKVCQLRAVTGRYKTDEESVSRSFLIAQDVQNVFPEAVVDLDPEKLGLSYTEVIPLLVAAVKELKAENDALKSRIEALESK